MTNLLQEIREAYEELSTLERQARMKNISSSPSTMFNIDQGIRHSLFQSILIPDDVILL